MSKRLELMQSKLIVGTKSIAQHTREQEAALEQKRRALAEQKARERAMQQEFEAKESFVSLQACLVLRLASPNEFLFCRAQTEALFEHTRLRSVHKSQPYLE